MFYSCRVRIQARDIRVLRLDGVRTKFHRNRCVAYRAYFRCLWVTSTKAKDCLERYVCLLTPKKIQIVSSLLVSVSSRVLQSTCTLLKKLGIIKAYNKRRILFNIKRRVEELFILVTCGDPEDASNMRTTWNVTYAGPCMADKSPVLHF